MFITHIGFKYPIPAHFISKHEQYWLSVGLVQETAWFLVRIHQMESLGDNEKFESLKTVMVANVCDIERLAKQDVKQMPRFESAQIVTPDKLNGTGTWKMDALKALWTANDPLNPDHDVEICETLSGEMYVVSVCSSPVDKLLNKKLRHQFPQAKSTQ
jgi:hypothetical protein